MTEEKKTQVIIDEEAFKDEESAYPGTPLSDTITKEQIRAMMEFRKEHELESKYPPFHYGYGHMSTTQLLALAKARKNVTIPNPNVNPQWSEVTDDAIKFATTICMEEDIQKIQDALHEFIDVEDSHSKFIRKALARSILKTEMRCRVNSKIDCNKMLDDREYSSDEIKEMMDYQKEDRIDLMYPPIHHGYGHMSTDKIPIIPNPNTNPQWTEIIDDAIKFAATISTEVDIEKIKADVYKFIDVENSSGRFIRVAMANSILRSEVKRRIKSKIDRKKMLEDHEYNEEEIKEMINETYGAPKKYKLHQETSFASIYVDYEGDGVK